jgi:hypothetical protein
VNLPTDEHHTGSYLRNLDAADDHTVRTSAPRSVTTEGARGYLTDPA